ncbi:hypothetical protein RYX36_004550 [Vicia faba]
MWVMDKVKGELMLAVRMGTQVDHFIVATCENMINGIGMRPGDILKASNGKTIEVNNNNAIGSGVDGYDGICLRIKLLLLALTCIAAIAKLGTTKVSCSQLFSMRTEITGSLMDMLVGSIPISQAYNSIMDVDLHREFLVHFGPQAATFREKDEWGLEEVVFWVNLAQRQLQQAIDNEKIWSRLTTSESIEVLEKHIEDSSLELENEESKLQQECDPKPTRDDVMLISSAPENQSYLSMTDYQKSGLYKSVGDADTFDKDGPYTELVTSNNLDGFTR